MVDGRDFTFYIQLDISTTDFHRYYSQKINSVITTSHTGQKVQFPANVLQPFISHAGVQGRFKLVVDQNSKFKSIDRVG